MHNAITIDALKVLDAIDRRGSFAGAASELFRVPSAISYTVQKLEDDLDIEIFDRSGHRARLTPAGRYLLEEGRALLDATDALAHATKQVAQGWETRIKIAVNSLLPMQALYPAIRDFQALGVPVEIQLIEEVFTGAWDALQCRRVDLVFGADALSRPAGQFMTRILGQIPFRYAVAPNHPLASHKGPISEEEIAGFPAIVAADSARHLQPATAGIFSRQRTITVTNVEQKISAQQAGLGVGWLPEPLIRDRLERGELVELDVEAVRQPAVIYLARHQENQTGEQRCQGNALKWFWDRLSEPGQFSRWIDPHTQ
ncbi:LysR family transcriptional regulator [Marinobacter halodurans]|uniref:LysR family transcriptional regulator n=1 Tax=Marinobacter halodurans TaxID=2528979 RepID=A0ABY1ZKA4_9GAMM|nr:LysR substrate-binding domain-containing protein [Marinobacter halodurans]TBW51008.1 LysR family transcriptional regulator [Marinobacter halodurans]